VSVYLRGNVWWLRYAGPDGSEVRETSEQTNRRAAERLERDRKREVAEGRWRPRAVGSDARPTVASFTSAWAESLRSRRVKTAQDYVTRMERHVLPVLGSRPLDTIRPRDVVAFVQQLDAAGTHAPRTVHHIFDALRSLCQWAVFQEKILVNPCLDLPPGVLPKKRDADPTWRATAIYEPVELTTLLYDAGSPEDRRVMYALESLGMLRFGEAAGRRWRDLAPASPMHMLRVLTQYDDEDTKTEAPRIVPVHPALAASMTCGAPASPWRGRAGRGPRCCGW
jgi:integrase